MPPEVIDAPPAKEEITPAAGKTNFGDKFRDALSREAKSEDTPPAAKGKKEASAKKADPTTVSDLPSPKKASALDLAIEGKPAVEAGPEVVEPDADHAAILKELEDAEKSKDWRKIRPITEARLKKEAELTGEVKRLQSELGKVDPKTGETLALTAKERDELKAKNAELLEVITRINVKYSPEYQAKYVHGRDKLVERAVSRVKEYGGNVEQFAQAMALTGKRRTEAMKVALADVDPMDHPRIISVLDQIQSLDDEAGELESNPQHSFEELESKRSQERARMAEEGQRVRQQEFDKVDRSLKSKSFALRTVDPTSEGGSEWNDDVKGAFDRANAHFAPEASIGTLREIAVKGERYDGLEKMLTATSKELAAANKRLREYDEASPDFRGSGKKPDAAAHASPGEKYYKALEAEQGGTDDGV